jgi:hypothetical protein
VRGAGEPTPKVSRTANFFAASFVSLSHGTPRCCSSRSNAPPPAATPNLRQEHMSANIRRFCRKNIFSANPTYSTASQLAAAEALRAKCQNAARRPPVDITAADDLRRQSAVSLMSGVEPSVVPADVGAGESLDGHIPHLLCKPCSKSPPSTLSRPPSHVKELPRTC